MTRFNTKILPPEAKDVFDGFVAKAGGSFLQTSAWASVKSLTGWKTKTVALFDGENLVAGAQVFILRLPLGQKISYVPHGPVWDKAVPQSLKAILNSLKEEAEGIALKIEPAEPSSHDLTKALLSNGFIRSPRSLQPVQTIVNDLAQDESVLMSGMRQTTRRYIRQAERNGLRVWEDLPGEKLADFYKILNSLGDKVGFSVHSIEYYKKIKTEFGNQARIFLVARGDTLLGSYFLITQGEKAWELYGGVNKLGQELKAGYFLKWQVMRAMRGLGIRWYDQWGVAPEGITNHELSGVTYFKEGFGGDRLERVGAYDLVREPIWYHLLSLAEVILRRRF